MSDTTLSDLTNNLGSQSQRTKNNQGLKEKDSKAQSQTKNESKSKISETKKDDSFIQDDLLFN